MFFRKSFQIRNTFFFNFRQFKYGGCLGNGNRFITKASASD